MNFLTTYITIEDISSGLFRTQIIDLLKVLSDKSNLEFEIIVLNVPWKYKQNKKKLKEYRLELKRYPVTIKYYSFLPPMRYCTKSSIYLSITILWLSTILKFVISSKTKILHCRSYMATFCANLVTNKPIIFDMRSLWVLENISAGNIKSNSFAHKGWNYIESYCLKNSVISTAVSKWMIDYLRPGARDLDFRLISIGVDMNKFFYNFNLAKQLRRKLNVNNKLVIIYSGSLGLSGLNIEAFCNLVAKIASTQVNFKLVILSNDSKKSLNNTLKRMPVNLDIIVISPKQQDINGWLSVGDIGIHALPQQLDSQSRLGTKVVEYWANGMPVIVNNNVGDAAGYINDRGLGIVLSGSELSLIELNEFLSLSDHRESYKIRCRQVVKENFDMELVSDKYLQCYFDASQTIQ